MIIERIMNRINYFKRLGLSDYIIEQVSTLIELNELYYLKYVYGLTKLEEAESTFLKIKEDYPNDIKSFNILSIYLLASINTLKKYKEKKISKKIFYDTLKCISRFINECVVMNNDEYFDRDFWVHRQLSLKLFRIGELEYEFINENNKLSISIHIPSDAILTKNNIDKSINKLHKFVNKYYKEYDNATIYCDSWLLSPNLKRYLNEDSKILVFQNYFEIKEFNETTKDFIRWLFMTMDYENISSFKENTSLQRKVKEALLNNENIGSAYGILK